MSDDERAIIGQMKTLGLKGADEIFNFKRQILSQIAFIKVASVFIILVSPVGFILVVPGIMMIAGGIFGLVSMNKKATVVRSAIEIYCQELGIESV